MSAISRSIYQKLKEENKRLIKDIRILVSTDITIEQYRTIKKWRDKFKKEIEFNDLMRALINPNKEDKK